MLATYLRWSGLLDVMAIEGGPATATIKVSAEHAGIDLIRPTVSLYSDAEQRRLAANAPSLQYMADQQDMRVVWPAASWGLAAPSRCAASPVETGFRRWSRST